MASPAPTRRRSPIPAPPLDRRPVARPSIRPSTAEGRVTGRYRLDPTCSAWWWSSEMHQLLGVPLEGVSPCTELLLQCVHRDDRGRVLRAVTSACATGRPFAVETRVLHRDGTQRVVVLLGEPQLDPGGLVTALEGMCVDITEGRITRGDDVVAALQTEVGQLRTAMASRATIEQAKGILMLLTNCSDQVAFELLAHMSSHTHRKVREVAETITESATGRAPLPEDLRTILRDACPPSPRHA